MNRNLASVLGAPSERLPIFMGTLVSLGKQLGKDSSANISTDPCPNSPLYRGFKNIIFRPEALILLEVHEYLGTEGQSTPCPVACRPGALSISSY